MQGASQRGLDIIAAIRGHRAQLARDRFNGGFKERPEGTGTNTNGRVAAGQLRAEQTAGFGKSCRAKPDRRTAALGRTRTIRASASKSTPKMRQSLPGLGNFSATTTAARSAGVPSSDAILSRTRLKVLTRLTASSLRSDSNVPFAFCSSPRGCAQKMSLIALFNLPYRAWRA